ncbi:MAG: Hpt domain-containing protein [Lachnospiraceae bacterium]|nr:Hpt domain-containing protein [Lachnospiraceae bacterium]
MKLEELYAVIGGDFHQTVERFGGNERLIKLITLFLEDQSIELLKNSIERKEWREAFRISHNIKGTAMNLSFPDLYEVSVKLTDALRSEEELKDMDLYFNVLKEYNRTKQIIRKFV